MNDESGVERVDHVGVDAGVRVDLGVEAGVEADGGVQVVSGRRTVVTALPLKKTARQRLAQLLDARVLDVREPCEEPDLVLTPACSPQLIGALKRKYRGARVVIVELDDWDLDIAIPGPVKRVLRAGADAYVLADSLEELARKIDVRSPDREVSAVATPTALAAGATVDELIAAFLRESVEYSTRVHPHSTERNPTLEQS